MAEQLPPRNREAEAAVLGSLIIDNDALFHVSSFLKPEMFTDPRNRKIYTIAMELANANEPIDVVTVGDRLGDDESYMYGLVTKVPTALNIVHYGRVVEEKSRRRQLIHAASTIASAAYDEARPIEVVTSEAEAAIMGHRPQTDSRVTSAKENAAVFVDSLENKKPVGIKTGYLDLDRCIGGLEPGFGYWFCAAEKMGKTSLVNGISLYNAKKGRVVVRFSLEMSAEQRTRRDIAVLTGIPINKLKSRNLESQEISKAFEFAGQLSGYKLIIDDTPGISPNHIRSTLNRVVMKYGRVDLIEVDYFQLMSSDKRNNNRVQELESISRGLVHVIRDFKVPMIATAQILSKEIDKRQDKRPQLSDVHGSATLAKDAYFLSFVYRDEYYSPETTLRPGEADLIVRAHRDGSTPTIALHFDGPTARFTNAYREPATNGQSGQPAPIHF